jgi:hypothetical protein
LVLQKKAPVDCAQARDTCVCECVIFGNVTWREREGERARARELVREDEREREREGEREGEIQSVNISILRVN